MISSQGSTKVYKSKSDRKRTKQRVGATVQSGGLLVMLPDPVVPFAESRYQQTQVFELVGDASAIVVDICSAGRLAHNNERWVFDSYASRSSFRQLDVYGQAQSHIEDAIELMPWNRGLANWGMDIGGVSRDSFATVVALGPRSQAFGDALLKAGREVAARCGARTVRDSTDDGAVGFELPELAGGMCMGASRLEGGGAATNALEGACGDQIRMRYG